MVDVLLAFDRVQIEDDDISKLHAFRQTGGGTLAVDTVLGVDVFEKRSSIGNNGITNREYELAVAYTAGGNALHVRMEKAEIDNSFTGAPSTFIRSIDEPGATADVDFNAVPILTTVDRILYNLFVWGIGIAGGATRDLYAQRIPKDQDFESAISGIVGATTFDYSVVARPIQSPEQDILDYFTLVT